MTDKNRITAILVDTCAYRTANCDFIGAKSKLLPSFFSAINEKGLLLLSHPILDNEITKRIAETGFCKDYERLTGLINKYRVMLEEFERYNVECIDEIIGYDISSKLREAYDAYYSEAYELDYPEPADVFELYFSTKPPFSSSGDKKNEFPDAFVIEAAKKYLGEHSYDSLLVISEDNDWISSFKTVTNVVLCKTIKEALGIINDIKSVYDMEMLKRVFELAYPEIILKAQDCTNHAEYEVNQYVFLEGLNIDNVEVMYLEDEFLILQTTKNSMLIKTFATLRVSGGGEIIDNNKSLWSREENIYLFVSYADLEFTDSVANVDCEIKIEFDAFSIENSVRVVDVRFVNKVDVLIDYDDVVLNDIDDRELAIRCLREDMGLPRKWDVS